MKQYISDDVRLRVRSCCSYMPWRMIIGAVIGCIGLGIGYRASMVFTSAASEIYMDFNMKQAKLYKSEEAASLAEVIVYVVATAAALFMSFWRWKISRDVDNKADASHHANLFNIMATVLNVFFWLLTLGLLFLVAALAIVGTTGITIAQLAVVAQEVQVTMKDGGVAMTHTAGTCPATCVNIAPLFGKNLTEVFYGNGCLCDEAKIDRVAKNGVRIAALAVIAFVGAALQFAGTTWMQQSLTAAAARTTKEQELLEIRRAAGHAGNVRPPAGNYV